MAWLANIICILVRKGKEEWFPLPRSWLMNIFSLPKTSPGRIGKCWCAAWGSGSLWVWQGRWIIILGGRSAFSPCFRAYTLSIASYSSSIMLPATLFTRTTSFWCLIWTKELVDSRHFCEMNGSMMAALDMSRGAQTHTGFNIVSMKHRQLTWPVSVKQSPVSVSCVS